MLPPNDISPRISADTNSKAMLIDVESGQFKELSPYHRNALMVISAFTGYERLPCDNCFAVHLVLAINIIMVFFD